MRLVVERNTHSNITHDPMQAYVWQSDKMYHIVSAWRQSLSI